MTIRSQDGLARRSRVTLLRDHLIRQAVCCLREVEATFYLEGVTGPSNALDLAEQCNEVRDALSAIRARTLTQACEGMTTPDPPDELFRSAGRLGASPQVTARNPLPRRSANMVD